MYPLLILSLIGFVVFIERTMFLHKGHIGASDFVSGIKNLVRKQRLVEALTLCEDTPGPLPNIVKSALLQYGQARERVYEAIQGAALVEIPVLERRIGTIAMIARVAPLLGFLGTLVGGLQALYFLDAARGDSAVFTQYLAQALLTSTMGIGIAIMATLAHHFLYGRVRALTHEFEWVGHEMYQFLDTLEGGAHSAENDVSQNEPEMSGGGQSE